MRAWRCTTAGSTCWRVLQPGTPPDLADAVRKFANNLMDIGARSTSGIPNSDPAQAARLKEADDGQRHDHQSLQVSARLT